MIDLLKKLVDFILHIDAHLSEIIRDYGMWTYGVLFLIIFAETGLVVMPLLPGDSLLFAAGALAALPESGLNVHLMAFLLFIAAVLGDSLNYWIGNKIGPAVFRREDSIWLRKKHLERAHQFFERYGGRAIILARFVPIVRTFVPFVAGVGAMTYRRFFMFNVVGGFIWIYAFTYLGFFFGNLPLVKKNFGLVIMAIIVVSVLPIVFEFARGWLAKRKLSGSAG
ncbi:DedA family protein [Rariglobus hedericola]|uniref:DedA family protein n=1 Tax=Rariglobus hedericola TaxID=2597822 RepID=A0A556QMY4_9BACT|nr:DedA family protein [Rariglobus hedericola]TSJ77993.1 DedA family protein [Rariglobus hedericola]